MASTGKGRELRSSTLCTARLPENATIQIHQLIGTNHNAPWIPLRNPIRLSASKLLGDRLRGKTRLLD
jgi:hypothetical protein